MKKEEAVKILERKIGKSGVVGGNFYEIDRTFIDELSDTDTYEEEIQDGCSDIEPKVKILKITDKEGIIFRVSFAKYENFQWIEN